MSNRVKVWKITLYGVPTGEYYYNDLAASRIVHSLNVQWGGADRPYRTRIGYIMREA